MNLLGHPVGLDQPIFLIAGPCVVESEELQLRTAERLKAITDKLGIVFIFKSSFDKANRSSDRSYRGPGMDEGLRILEKVKNALDVPVLTDVHDIPRSLRSRKSSTFCRPPHSSPARPTSSMRLPHRASR
jgi:2-dehydro-3-deoxyphosphooctonate aldolase (KDO 8-P synthase)